MKLTLYHRGEPIEIDLAGAGAERQVRLGEKTRTVRAIHLTAEGGSVAIDGRPVRFLYDRESERIRVAVGGETHVFELSAEPRSRRAGRSRGNPETRSPMPGKVLQVSAKTGQEVSPGDPLLILEAMKMENVLSAEIAGTVEEIHVEAGDMVEPGKLLVVVTPKE